MEKKINHITFSNSNLIEAIYVKERKEISLEMVVYVSSLRLRNVSKAIKTEEKGILRRRKHEPERCTKSM
jgi:hypothetical protein